jgi:hypothetical protein
MERLFLFLANWIEIQLIILIIFIGAIVAVQDVDQHMYFTVEGGDNKYNLVGAVHYSLVGERALFRVWNL